LFKFFSVLFVKVNKLTVASQIQLVCITDQ